MVSIAGSLTAMIVRIKRAFDLYTWYRAWSKATKSPTHIHVEASDEFQATVPWEEQVQADFGFKNHVSVSELSKKR
jgi:hypothetical protein